MSAITPRRSSRLPHTHTPKMSERKKSLFHSEAAASRESLTKHRRLPVVDSESDSDDCDLGIISTLDSSSGDEVDQGVPKTPERRNWHGTRSSKLLKESNDLKNFIKSPFTLNKYQTKYSCSDKNTGSLSTPVTPHMQNHPGTPSSTHSCTSVHTTSSTSSKARKSLASLIADTESCSSSLKDLNFDTDSGTDTKENTPTKSVRRSGRKQKLTPKFQSFKGILLEQKKNVTPPPLKSAIVCLTKMDMSVLSPTQMLKTPNTTEASVSPPKLGHNRRSVVEIAESPESCDSEKSHKRLRNNSITEYGPVSKHPKLDANPASKARISLFNSDKLKEILSAKCFYGKSNPDLNSTITTKLANAIEVTSTHRRRLFTHSYTHRRKRNSGQINLGVRHRIRKPKVSKNKMFANKNNPYINKSDTAILNNSRVSNVSANNFSMNNVSMPSQNSSQEIDEKDKADPFDKEKQTIEALLSQWTEEEVPESEIHRPELPCFNSSVIAETSQIFQPVTAIPVSGENVPDGEAVIIELGADAPPKPADADVTMTELHKTSHGEVPNAKFLPVDGGFILVDENAVTAPTQEELPDLDEIERELKMLDEQILLMTQADDPRGCSVNEPQINTAPETEPTNEHHADKLFPIFSKPNPGASTPSSKATKGKKSLLKDASNQYVIDAGQKRFGATQCTECGVIYQIGDPQDEHDHLVHHNATDVLKFNGWKEECVVGRWESARCVRVRGGEQNWRRVAALLARVVHAQLGYGADLPRDTHTYTAYLYIDKKQIVGCAILEPKTRAFKLIPGDPDCCTTEDYPVMCGVSRIWTHPMYRRRGVGSRLLDCGRASFLYGAALLPSDMAFSAPTPPGKALASKYCGTDRFYVYLD